MSDLALKKGTSLHKTIGIVWVLLMLIASFSSFFIIPTGSFTWLHLFSVLVIFCIPVGVLAIRKGNTKRHMYYMVGAFIGTVISAYFAVMTPGRFLYEVFF